MGDSRLHGDALNKEKRNSQNTWIPTTHWVAGFLWHYVQRANRENFLYDLRNIDGESLQYTRYEAGQFYGWHNDAGLATQYKPQSVGNRADGLAQDFVNENIELVRKLSFSLQLSDPDDYEGGNVQLLDEAGKVILHQESVERLYFLTLVLNIEFLKLQRELVRVLLGGLSETGGAEP
jgi:predicted 2-oxoglutarate/Fe(II)-dependent dioxygenase YbiX